MGAHRTAVGPPHLNRIDIFAYCIVIVENINNFMLLCADAVLEIDGVGIDKTGKFGIILIQDPASGSSGWFKESF
jgi:hypothetical protein